MIRTIRLFPVFALAGFGLAGCAGQDISKDDCRDANYYQLGLEDGKEGRSADRLQKFREVCGAENVAEDRYTYGRRVGLVEYCNADKGRDDAKEGTQDPVCVESAVPPYETAYVDQLSERRDEIMDEINELQRSKEELQRRQDQLQSQLNQINQRQETVVQQ